LESNIFKRLIHRREAGIFFALVGLVILIACVQPNFINLGNLFLVSRQIALTAIIALGVLFVILTGGIDLSVGSAVGLSGFICGLAMAAGFHPIIAVVAGLLTGAILGAVNGTIVAYVGVTPFIVTLGMLGVARGAVLVIKHGDSVREISKGFIAFGNGSIFGISVPVIVLVLAAIACHLILGRTIFGRQVFAIGGNEKAAGLSGINTRQVKFTTYMLSGLLSAITGILFVARFQSAQADSGKGMELDAIAAAVIGGTSLMGGEGSVPGVLLGAIIMGVIRNGLVLMQVSSYWQELIIGTIIVLAAILDVIRSRKQP
jgi:ribose/xylose/arabinose/galactoside ABC-type transport system permease subunit